MKVYLVHFWCSNVWVLNKSRKNVVQSAFNAQQFGTAQIGFGGLGLLVLLANRLSLISLSDTQSRLDIVSVIACAAISLDALSTQGMLQIEKATQPAIGTRVDSTESSVQKWLLDSIVHNIPAAETSCIIDQSSGVKGIVGISNPDNVHKLASPIVLDILEKRTELYLPDLQVKQK